MNETERKAYEDQLPEGWRLMLSKRQVATGSEWSQERLQAVNDRHNVVLEGCWPWILREVTKYAIGPKGGH